MSGNVCIKHKAYIMTECSASYVCNEILVVIMASEQDTGVIKLYSTLQRGISIHIALRNISGD